MHTLVDILLIDDAAQVRSRLAVLFADVPGVDSIFQAGDVRQAKELFERHYPDVVVLDLRLRQESGLSLILHIKRCRKETLVIVLTNDASAHHRKNCRLLGADHFFDKSREFESVLPVLAQQASRRNSPE
jgi:two-component system, OmpR family, response regulator